ncbi:MAG: hypothetical protein QM725_02090 [Lacibacter sp.]
MKTFLARKTTIFFFLFFYILCAFTALSQKKISPVTQSTITNITLPAGSKLDKRLVSEMAGKSLLQIEAKKLNTSVTSIEILYLPVQSGFSNDSLNKSLTANGWNVSAIESDNKYVLLKKNNQSVITYFEITKTDISLYFGEINITQPAQGNNNNPVQTNTTQTSPPAPVETTEQTTQQTTQPTQTNNQTPLSDGFKFNTTNFDDGWTSTVQEDWVEVTKGSIKVLLHYPKEGTIFPADPAPLINAAWNILVAPRYSNLTNYKTAYINTYNRPYLGMGYVKENSSGAQKFAVLFRQGETGWIEFVCPDKNSFIQEFKFDPETVQWDTDSDLMNHLSKMKNYNKFAIAASDFKGKWTSDFTGILQMYHVYTGNYAGMNIHQSNEEFVFSGKTYKWKLLAINGMVGSTRYDQAESSGTFSVPNNWQLQCSKIEKGPKTYNAFWSCIKGARILNLIDAQYPGSGLYTQYGMAK